MNFDEPFDTNMKMEFANNTGEYLKKCTLQLFRSNSDEGTVAHASGVLFSFNEMYFLISAAHNFIDENKNEIKLRVGPHLETILDSKLKFTLATGEIGIDKIDISVLHIKNQNLINLLLQYNTFIGINDVSIDHIQKKITADNSDKNLQYLIFGYPGRQTKQRYQSFTDWKIKALYHNVYFKHSNLTHIENMGFSNHIYFDKLKKGNELQSNDRINLPEFEGMSGCGIWNVSEVDQVNQRFKIGLVGIFIEIQSDLGLSTRIDFAIEIIRAHFNCAALPSSNYVREWQKLRHTTSDAHKQGYSH